jgi:hypothetical protein
MVDDNEQDRYAAEPLNILSEFRVLHLRSLGYCLGVEESAPEPSALPFSVPSQDFKHRFNLDTHVEG